MNRCREQFIWRQKDFQSFEGALILYLIFFSLQAGTESAEPDQPGQN